jgi:hypothetical protein
VPPAATGLGIPLLVTARSQATTTGVEIVVVLFAVVGSLVVAVTFEVAEIVPAATVDGTLTTTTMSAEALATRLGSLHVTVPVAPTAGEVQVQPAGAETDSNVVFVGVASVKTTPDDVAGPLLVTV